MSNDGRAPGPLDEVFGEIARERSSIPLSPVHTRVLQLDAVDHASWVLSCFRDPGGPLALHRQLRPRIEAALLAELSQPAASLREHLREYDAMRLFVFPEMHGLADALRAFGLSPVEARGPAMRQALSLLRGEAVEVGLEPPDEPSSVWETRVARADTAATMHAALLERTSDELWGERPGAPFERLASVIEEHGFGSVPPTLEGLTTVERLLVPGQLGVIRWVAPLLFQALCDMVAVVATRDLGQSPEWAVCEPDGAGLSPPPMVRIRRDGEHVHVPLGLEVLRWCVIPAQPGEQIPSLAEWARAAFVDAPA